jgi:hypothetical protein
MGSRTVISYLFHLASFNGLCSHFVHITEKPGLPHSIRIMVNDNVSVAALLFGVWGGKGVGLDH